MFVILVDIYMYVYVCPSLDN